MEDSLPSIPTMVDVRPPLRQENNFGCLNRCVAKQKLNLLEFAWIGKPATAFGGIFPRSPSVVSEATAEEKLVASLESAAVAFDTTLGLLAQNDFRFARYQ